MAMFMDFSVRRRKIYRTRRSNELDSFKHLYRFTENNVEWLAAHFLGSSHETRGGALSNFQKMQIFLRYVGDPGFQVGVGEDIGIHQTTVSKTIWNVCQKIASKSSDWIKFPVTKEDMDAAKNIWRRKFKFPDSIGALDCTHVIIQSPYEHADEYVNRKGLKSFNIQATCDANELFTSIDCTWPGSVHDSRIWKNSSVFQVMHENPAEALLLGDDGYGIAPWVMTPYRNPNTPQQQRYNKIHSSERVIIERVFGQVKRRFPFLQSKVRVNTRRIPSMILSCFVLHNIAKYLKDEEFEEVRSTSNRNIHVPMLDEVNNNDKKRGQARRNAITTYLFQL
ncbi:putative nuclease HARBI1 [Topomyia yanbarensis]|uniref:putative nuclease HARBI1 n=1 Tax=Topomyia yanbarensis TaxID=2498891 RepID=UPI00273C43F9|nr:putative nuclease HARBI1 [Topomyia yanbarensis]